MGFASFSSRREWEPYRILGPLLFLGAGLIPLALLDSAGTQAVLAVAVAAVFYLLVFIHIHLGLGLLVVCFGLSPEFEIAGISNFRIEDLFIPIVLLAWATRLSMRRESLEPTDLKVPILCLIGLGAISTLLNFAWWDLPLLHSILFFGKTVAYYLIFLVVLNVVKTREQVVAYAILLTVWLGLAVFGFQTSGMGGAALLGATVVAAGLSAAYTAWLFGQARAACCGSRRASRSTSSCRRCSPAARRSSCSGAPSGRTGRCSRADSWARSCCSS